MHKKSKEVNLSTLQVLGIKEDMLLEGNYFIKRQYLSL